MVFQHAGGDVAIVGVAFAASPLTSAGEYVDYAAPRWAPGSFTRDVVAPVAGRRMPDA